ncbi:O-antigen polymerase [Nitrosomonas sp.]|uniref:O-antigen polymerase n=1 Tax=Nitrosomonas sp. TaxID=42353 RepID=UPI001E096C60|nr:O-antigen polymerase [Nitrosomonas sp.]MBX3617912.1 oligosaccharide repeat unit polymerase [Nitrosomonas sp.]
MSQLRRSRWGATRPVSIILLGVALMSFTLSIALDLPWQINWCLLFVALSLELFQSLHDLSARFYVFDALLFSLGMLVFTVADPIFAVWMGTDFPGVDESFYSGNSVGNMAGLVITVFCLCFYLGRVLVRTSCTQSHVVMDPTMALKITTPLILMLGTLISLLAFLMNGGGFGLENLINTLTARARGYVAFSSSGLGTDDPLIALFGQAIPTVVILWLISINWQRWRWSVLAVLMGLFLFILYILLGGRSGVIFVLLTIVLYQIVRLSARPKILRMVLFGLLSIVILGLQANFRDMGEIDMDSYEHSPFRGYALNREIAFIVDAYGERIPFIHGPDVIPRIVLPLFETFAVFISNPIPRKFWTNKPVDPSFGPYNELRTGHTGFGASSNITPTIPGRYYINYGLPGVIQIGLIFGLLWRLFDRMMTNRPFISLNRILVAAMLNAIMFISLRDFTFGKFYPLLFLLFFMFIGMMCLSNRHSQFTSRPMKKE